MTDRDPDFDAYVLKIYEVLDKLDYYRLLGVDKDARMPQIKKAFFSIAAKFHPDRNLDADPKVKAAIYNIFKRLNEAYRVLGDHDKRTAYNKGLDAGEVRLQHEGRRNFAKKNLEDTIISKEAYQFFVQARDALAADNMMNAELYIQLAGNKEINSNEAITSLAAQIQAAKEAKKKL